MNGVRGQLFIFSGPSGSGKSTITKEVLKVLPGLAFSVSHTTRAPRPGEQDGRDYHFVSREQFLALRDQKPSGFVEWAEVHGNLYGTSVAEVQSRLAQGKDILLDIDVQGAHQVLAQNPDAVSIFLCPPSLEALAARLQLRAADSQKNIELRLLNAKEEMRHAPDYCYLIVNEDLDEAIAAFKSVVIAERLRQRRQPNGQAVVQAW